MVQQTQSEKQFLDILYDQQDTSGPSASQTAKIGEEGNSQLVLSKKEWAEIKYIMIIPPLDSNGDAEALEDVKPIIDGDAFQGGQLMRFKADNDGVVIPPRPNQSGLGKRGGFGDVLTYDLGLTLPELVEMGVDKNPNLFLQNTTIKTKEQAKLDVEYLVGNSAITGNFRVMMFGTRYTEKALDFWLDHTWRRFSNRPVQLMDPKSGRQFKFNISPVSTKVSDFDTLIGGNNIDLNGEVEVKRIDRWSRNAGATDGSGGDFVLSNDQSQVPNKFNNLDFSPDEDELYWFNRIGLRAEGNHFETKVEANGQLVFQDRIEESINNYEYGRTTMPSSGLNVSDHDYRPVPFTDPIFGHNENLQFIYEDDTNGTIGDGTNFSNGSLLVTSGLFIKAPELEVEEEQPNRGKRLFESPAGPLNRETIRGRGPPANVPSRKVAYGSGRADKLQKAPKIKRVR